MDTVFLEIIFQASDYATMNISGRDEIEDPLDDALAEVNVGEVTGGGSGSGVVIIEVEIEDGKNLEEGLSVIRNVLRSYKSPESTIIKRSNPCEVIYSVYE